MASKDFNYYLFIVQESNWDIVKSGNIIGTDNKDIYDEIKANDKILVYVSGISQIKGLYEVVSKYKENIAIFEGKIRPYRFKLNLIEFFEDRSEFKDLVPKLNFIENKEKWYTHLGGIKGVKALTLRDYTAMIKSLK